jgi:hypothetical protein
MEPEPSVIDYKYRETLKMTTIFDYYNSELYSGSNKNKEEYYYKLSLEKWYEESYKKLNREYCKFADDRDEQNPNELTEIYFEWTHKNKLIEPIIDDISINAGSDIFLDWTQNK